MSHNVYAEYRACPCCGQVPSAEFLYRVAGLRDGYKISVYVARYQSRLELLGSLPRIMSHPLFFRFVTYDYSERVLTGEEVIQEIKSAGWCSVLPFEPA